MKINQIYVNLPIKDVEKTGHSGRSLDLLLMNSFLMKKQYVS